MKVPLASLKNSLRVCARARPSLAVSTGINIVRRDVRKHAGLGRRLDWFISLCTRFAERAGLDEFVSDYKIDAVKHFDDALMYII